MAIYWRWRGRLIGSAAAVLLAVAVISGVWGVQQESRKRPLQPAQDEIAAPPEHRAMEQLMKQKLSFAQVLLEGVAKQDHAMVQESAARLIELSRLEAWERMASSRFVQDTADFVSAVEFLSRMAEARDTEGEELGFVRVAMCCATCHRHVRAEAVANIGERGRENLAAVLMEGLAFN
jgi:cytochrome c556